MEEFWVNSWSNYPRLLSLIRCPWIESKIVLAEQNLSIDSLFNLKLYSIYTPGRTGSVSSVYPQLFSIPILLREREGLNLVPWKVAGTLLKWWYFCLGFTELYELFCRWFDSWFSGFLFFLNFLSDFPSRGVIEL